MRRVFIGITAAAALAWANAGQADHHTAEGQRKKGDAAMQPGTPPSGAAAGREPGAVGPERSATGATRPEGRAEERGPFAGKKNFDVDGKVSHASAGELTIERKDGLPPATLKLGSGTKVELDGKRASADQLQPGQDVKASFNLRGSTAEAVEVEAKKAEKDDRRELQEQRRENEQERAKDAQKSR